MTSLILNGRPPQMSNLLFRFYVTVNNIIMYIITFKARLEAQFASVAHNVTTAYQRAQQKASDEKKLLSRTVDQLILV